MTEHAKTSAHLSAVAVAANEAKRVTIEAYALDADVDMAAVTFAFSPTDRGSRRVVTRRDVSGAVLIVGLWRIVPDEAAR